MTLTPIEPTSRRELHVIAMDRIWSSRFFRYCALASVLKQIYGRSVAPWLHWGVQQYAVLLMFD